MNQPSLSKRIWKWVWRLSLALLSILSILFIVTNFMLYTPLIAYFNRYRVCHNSPIPQPQELPQNLVSLAELDALVAQLSTTSLNYRLPAELATLYEHPTHPQGLFYFVEELGFYRLHIFACSRHEEFRPRYFGYDMDSDFDDYVWATQDKNLYIVHILYRFDTQKANLTIYDGNTLELVTRRTISQDNFTD